MAEPLVTGTRIANDGGELTRPCKIWTGHIRKSDGYGLCDGRMAHRVIYERKVGPIPDGHEIDHRCQVHACVEIEHLIPRTPAENKRLAYSPNREKTECPAGHSYAEHGRRGPNGKRYCLKCKRERRREEAARVTACRKGHPFDLVDARGRRRCSRCQSEEGRKAIMKRWATS